MSSAINVTPEVAAYPSEPKVEVSPSRFVYRIAMSRSPATGYQDLMLIVGENGEFVVTAYEIGFQSAYRSAKAAESWVMVTRENVERLGYAVASAAGGPGRAAALCFIRRPQVSDLERECIEGVVRVTADGDGLQGIEKLLTNHGVPFERWER